MRNGRRIYKKGSPRKGVRLRKAAYQILWSVERGHATDEILEQFRARWGDPRDRDFVTELVLGVLRHRALLDHVLHALSGSSFFNLKPEAKLLLRIGLYQIFFMSRVPNYAAVHATVEVTRHLSGISTHVVNALLRRAVGLDWQHLLPDPQREPIRYLTIRYSMPQWLVQRWVQRWGRERAECLLRALLERPVLYLRRNPVAPPRDRFVEVLAEEGIRVEPVGEIEDCYRVLRGNPVRTEAFRKGYFVVQDAASQMVPRLLDPRPGNRILDACAAPGNKTLAVVSLMESVGTVVLFEPVRQRLEETLKNFRRWFQRRRLVRPPLYLFPVAADATQPPLTDAVRFDRVLVDAPCSNLGVLRRHPDVKWRVTAEEIGRLAELQWNILCGTARYVRPGGRMVYAVCTLETEETYAVVDRFLQHFPDFERVPLDSLHVKLPTDWIHDRYYFITWPDQAPVDAFFAVVLRRRSAA